MAKLATAGTLATAAAAAPHDTASYDAPHGAAPHGDAPRGDAQVVLEENAVEGHGAHVVAEDGADGEHGGRHDPVRFYGPWTWAAGLALGAALMWMMFALSDAI